MRGKACLDKLLKDYEFETVLDIGCGQPPTHRALFEAAGKKWAGLDWDYAAGRPLHFVGGNWSQECLWLSHFLEHVDDVGRFLRFHREGLKPGGVLAIVVPELKHQIVGGHVNLFNAGLLLYRLVLAGFDCSKAAVLTQHKEISVIVTKPAELIKLPNLHHDRGDIELLAQWFPEGCRKQGFDGRIERLNW